MFHFQQQPPPKQMRFMNALCKSETPEERLLMGLQMAADGMKIWFERSTNSLSQLFKRTSTCKNATRNVANRPNFILG